MRFSTFAKGWIARALPELMPEGSLQRCTDLNFTIEGALRSVRELGEIGTVPTGLSGSRVVKEYFSCVSGSNTRSYFIKGGQLRRQVSGKSSGLQVMSGLSYATYVVMTPNLKKTHLTYIATPAGLIRDSGNTGPNASKYVTGASWTEVGLPPVGGHTGASLEMSFTKHGTELITDGANRDFANLTGGWRQVGGGRAIEAGQFKFFGSGTGVTAWLTGNSINVSTSGLSTMFKFDFIRDAGANMTGVTVRTSWDNGANVTISSGLTVRHFPEDESINVRLPITTVGDCTGLSIHVYGLFNAAPNNVFYIDNVSIKEVQWNNPITGLSIHGDYDVAYTWYDSTTGSESYPSGVSSWTGISYGIQVTWPARGASATGAYADTVRIYRTESGQGTLYYAGGVSRLNTSGSTISRRPDSVLGEPLGEVGRPEPTSTVVTSFGGRLWTAGATSITEGTDNDEDASDRIYYSRRFHPEITPPDYYINLGETETEVKAFAVMSSSLYIFTKRKVYELVGSTSSSYDVDTTLSHVGTSSAKSVAVGTKGIYFVTYDGVYVYKTRSKIASTKIDWVFSEANANASNTWNSVISRTNLEDSRGEFWNGRYYLSLPNPSGVSTFVYEEEFDRWYARSNQFTCLWRDDIDNILWGGVSFPANYTVARLITDGTAGQAGLYGPDFVTRAQPIEVDRDTKTQKLGYISEFRVHALGFWVFYFYIDEALVHTQTGTTYNTTDRYTIYKLPQSKKGMTCYVRGVASGNSVTPNGCRFYSMEVR